jgi:hypothetical protein
MDTIVISRAAFEFDGHQAHSVTDRASRRLIGHVARVGDQWASLPVTAERGRWMTGGGTRENAVVTLVKLRLCPAVRLLEERGALGTGRSEIVGTVPEDAGRGYAFRTVPDIELAHRQVVIVHLAI